MKQINRDWGSHLLAFFSTCFLFSSAPSPAPITPFSTPKVSLWYPARAPRERRGSSRGSPKPYRHCISVAKIVEVLQGTELPEALGWQYELEAGEAAPWMGWMGLDWRNRAQKRSKKAVMNRRPSGSIINYYNSLGILSLILVGWKWTKDLAGLFHTIVVRVVCLISEFLDLATCRLRWIGEITPKESPRRGTWTHDGPSQAGCTSQPGWGISRCPSNPCRITRNGTAAAAGWARPMIFAHGYLGSRFEAQPGCFWHIWHVFMFNLTPRITVCWTRNIPKYRQYHQHPWNWDGTPRTTIWKIMFLYFLLHQCIHWLMITSYWQYSLLD